MLERFAFYEAAKNAYAIVHTGQVKYSHSANVSTTLYLFILGEIIITTFKNVTTLLANRGFYLIANGCWSNKFNMSIIKTVR